MGQLGRLFEVRRPEGSRSPIADLPLALRPRRLLLVGLGRLDWDGSNTVQIILQRSNQRICETTARHELLLNVLHIVAL